MFAIRDSAEGATAARSARKSLRKNLMIRLDSEFFGEDTLRLIGVYMRVIEKVNQEVA